jgi:hypothetical protein
MPHAEPSESARAMRRLGSGIVGVINAVSLKGSTVRGTAPSLPKDGLTIQIVRQGDEAAEYKFWHPQVTHKIKVFASLAGWLGAYRMGDEEAPLLLCCRALILALSCMRPKPVPGLLNESGIVLLVAHWIEWVKKRPN